MGMIRNQRAKILPSRLLSCHQSIFTRIFLVEAIRFSWSGKRDKVFATFPIVLAVDPASRSQIHGNLADTFLLIYFSLFSLKSKLGTSGGPK